MIEKNRSPPLSGGTSTEAIEPTILFQKGQVHVPCRKSHWLCRPDRLLLATAPCRSRTNQKIRKDEPI